jgi:hypothetical protein
MAAQRAERVMFWTALGLGTAGILILATEGSSHNAASTTTTQASTNTTTTTTGSQ